ncbi:hypothetical protein ABZP36_015742 [Zizania latifolia]
MNKVPGKNSDGAAETGRQSWRRGQDGDGDGAVRCADEMQEGRRCARAWGRREERELSGRRCERKIAQRQTILLRSRSWRKITQYIYEVGMADAAATIATACLSLHTPAAAAVALTGEETKREAFCWWGGEAT